MDRRPPKGGLQNPAGHVTEMVGHVPEFGGHDAETVGHDGPKYATDQLSVQKHKFDSAKKHYRANPMIHKDVFG